jgi:UDP-glucose 4-epimerase
MATENDICVVVGATGCAGPRLVQRLVTSGFRVRAIARARPKADLLPQQAEVHLGDINDRAFLINAITGAKYVFHLAAKLHIVRPGEKSVDEYRRVNVEGTRSVVEVSREANVERLVYFSTINVYGSPRSQGAVIDERAPTQPHGVYAETKLAAEEIVLGSTNRTLGKPWGTVLRFAAIYGPHMKGNYVRLTRSLSRRIFVSVGDGSNRRTLISEEDAARAACLVAEHPSAGGQIYNVSDGQIHSVTEIVGAICEALGRRPPRMFLPTPLAIKTARLLDALLNPMQRSLNLSLAVEKMLEDMPVRAEKIQQELGFRPKIGLREGWAHTVREWRKQRAYSSSRRSPILQARSNRTGGGEP